MKKIFALLLAVIMVLSLAACGSGSSGDGSTLVYGSGDYDSINPIMNEHCEIKHLLFDSLVKRDGDGNLVPSLATEWSYDEAAFVYTFKLAEGVKWHDGEAFTAEDVKFTIEAIMDPDNGSENYPNYEEVSAINVISDTEIQFVLSEPNYAFLDYMTMSILPEHKLAGEDMWESDYFKNPIGTGPYKLESWDVGQAITLVKNEDYFAGAAKIDTIIFKIVTDDSAKALQLKNGELDLAQVTPKDAAAFDGEEGLTVLDMATADYRGILYNFWNPFWQENADLIPAINFCIDRQAIVDAVLLGQGFPAYSPIQLNKYNYEGVEHYDYAPAKAVEVLGSIGCEKDAQGYWCRNGERISFTINATPGDQVRIDMAQIAAQQLQQIGLDVKANVPAEGIDWGGQECCIIGWGSPFDADDHTYKVFGTGKGANYSGYSNADVDKYLTLARQTAIDSERAEYYKQFQIAMAEAPAYTFFCYIDAMYVADSRLKGIDTNTVLGHHGVGIFWNITEWSIEN
ncbi:MAG: ABC transporter substrate-binding protein [Oscillospiraceae bacterium]|nr:ABC transporter substrate-binding protein [Oscillospiraceae bacterium]